MNNMKSVCQGYINLKYKSFLFIAFPKNHITVLPAVSVAEITITQYPIPS